MRVFLLLTALFALLPAVAAAQAPADSIGLRGLLDAAVAQDPRARQAALQAALTDLRLHDLGTGRRPQLVLGGEATYQSEVPAFELPIPGVEGPRPPHLRAQATLDAEQLVWDGGRIAAQEAAERARLVEAQAGVTAALYPLRLAVAEAFFGARLSAEREALVDLQLRDLEARRDLVATQAREGAALTADVAAVEAEQLRLGQQRDEATADRLTALAVLADLTGAAIPPGAALAVPTFPPLPDAAPTDTTAPGGRPEFRLYGARRDRVAAEAEALARQGRPRVSVFGQAGVGRPGLAQFDPTIHPYGLVGVRARWPLLDWGAAGRARAAARLQQQVVDAEETAFARGLRRDVEDERRAVDRLTRALATDDAIIDRRAEVERVARRQLEEGVLLTADYTRRLDELYTARATRALHRAQLDQARARYLLTLGLF